MTNLQTAISIFIELEHRKGRRGGGYGRTISFIYALFIYLEQPHFINSHYFKTIRHLIITVLKGGKQERRRDTGRRRDVLYAKGRIKIGPTSIQQIITIKDKRVERSFNF